MDHFLTVCEQAARAGGKVLLDWQDRFTPREKAPRDLVTEADLASQQVIQDILLSAFPEHGFLGEEDASLAAGRKTPQNAEYRWIVDPLDGTQNYVHHLPAFAVSIALERQGELQVGVVYDPLTQECFSAAKGKGAFVNGKALKSSRCLVANEALVAFSFPSQVARDSIEIRRFIEAGIACQSLRRLGSAALNLAYVASGRLDAYWATSVKIWDVAAGVLLVQEAGGLVTALNGGVFELEKAHFLASATPPLHEEMISILQRAET